MTPFDPSKDGYTAALRMYLASFLIARGINGYYNEASENAKFPYVVYTLRHISAFEDSMESRRYVMEVDAYNKGPDVVLENLLDYMEAHIVGRYSDNRMTLDIAPGFGRIDVEEAYPLKRKRVLFDVKYWYKECGK